MTKTFQGLGLSPGTAEGPAILLTNRDQITGNYTLTGADIVVVKGLRRQLSDDLEDCAGLVATGGSMTSHAGIVSRDIGFPAVGDCPGVFKEIKSGDTILIDGKKGKITIK